MFTVKWYEFNRLHLVVLMYIVFLTVEADGIFTGHTASTTQNPRTLCHPNTFVILLFLRHLHILSASGKDEDWSHPFQVQLFLQSCMIPTLLDSVCHETNSSGALRPVTRDTAGGANSRQSRQRGMLGYAWPLFLVSHACIGRLVRCHIVHSFAILLGHNILAFG